MPLSAGALEPDKGMDWMLHYMRTTFTDAFVCRSSGARQRYGLDAALYENYLY